MPVYHLSRTQRLPISLEQAWAFFSSPLNLKEITPEHMDFRVTSDLKSIENMYAGLVITYTVRPLLGIPMFWMTEITHVVKHQFFVDEQRVGPYRIWRHQHHFKAIPGGVEMTDIVHYQPPLGFLGAIANSLFIRRQLKSIFDYRYDKLERLFGKMT